jgi:hypothetical protein
VNEAIDQLLSDSGRQAIQALQQQQPAAPGHGSPWLIAVIVPITVAAGVLDLSAWCSLLLVVSPQGFVNCHITVGAGMRLYWVTVLLCSCRVLDPDC